MKPRRPSLQLERAAAHLLRARTDLDEAAHALSAMREEAWGDAACDRLALASELAAAQARLVEALAAAIHAAPHSALDDLLAAIAGGNARAAASKRH